MTSIGLVWMRVDLRLADNPAIFAASTQCDRILPIYIYNPEEDKDWPLGAASLWWLHQSLKSLNQDLSALGSRLIIKRGNALQTLLSLAEKTGASRVYWNRRYDPSGWARDKQLEQALKAKGLEVHTFNAYLLHEPQMVRSSSGQPFRVFTPFWNHLKPIIQPITCVDKPKRLTFTSQPIHSEALETLNLEPKIDWASGMRGLWQPGENGAQLKLDEFLKNGLGRYDRGRNHPDQNGVSMLSPHIHFGEISPKQIWLKVQSQSLHGQSAFARNVYLKELGWREFAYHVLFNFPSTSNKPLRNQFENFGWLKNTDSLRRWQKGQTGFPIIDAGMRQLWRTGWMHNRVRMIAASFLTKDLLQSWLDGAVWFWDTLVDADLASNTLGWQWSAGCGADAAPYFRIFNPVLQGEKFDPEGNYVRRWVPELGKLPNEWVHKPWQAPPAILERAQITLGQTYPVPIVDHAWARRRALEAFAELKHSV